MDYTFTYSLLFMVYLVIPIHAETYNVNIKTDRHINVVDSKFLSFTIDPKFLFSSGEKYKSKECLCMASSLAPAYIRVAGPSTSHLSFRNSTIYIDDQLPMNQAGNASDGLTRRQWSLLLRRTARARLQPVVALSTRPRTAAGLWDPNPALDALSAAHRHRAQDMYWQLGYECSNQTIEEYLNDLETLRVIIATFPSGKSGQWKVVGGDITNCLQANSKSDFKDYVTFSNDMMDAIFLNGNSSFREIERMTERDRYDLFKSLSLSETPLWFTGHSKLSSVSPLRSLERAMEWLSSLGAAAADGYSVHFWDLEEDELWQPTLSFYMALLFKNLVGRRVLSVYGSSQVPLFSSCASRGSLVLYGANPNWWPAHLAVEGAHAQAGDVLQYVLRLDDDGNIVVNGHTMQHEGDIKPVVKRVRAYKTLMLKLPPKSFGFWVIANTQVEACNVNGTVKDNINYDIETNNSENNNFIKTKRSVDTKDFTSQESVEDSEESITWKQNKAIKESVDNINHDLRKYHKKSYTHFNSNRIKRQTGEDDNISRPKKTTINHKVTQRRNTDKQSLADIIVSKVPGFSKDYVGRIKKNIFLKLRDFKRNFKLRPIRKVSSEKQNKGRKSNNGIQKSNTKSILNNIKDIIKIDVTDKKIRNRRSVNKDKKYEEYSIENEVLENSKETFEIGKIIKKLKKLGELPIEIHSSGDKDNEDYKENDSNEGIILKTKLSDDTAVIDITEKSSTGLFKSTLQEILSLLADFNKNMKTFLTAITVLE